MFCIIGGALGTIIMFGVYDFLIGSQDDITTSSEKNRHIFLNFILKTPVAYLVLWGVCKFFGY